MTKNDAEALFKLAKSVFAFYPEYVITRDSYHCEIKTNSQEVINWFQSKGMQGKIWHRGNYIVLTYTTTD